MQQVWIQNRIKVGILISAICLSFFIKLPLHGQVLFKPKHQKGFEALTEFDFFRARKYFRKALKKNKNKGIATYGLSLVHLDSLNHFYSLDSAFYRLNQTDTIWQTLNQKKKIKFQKFGLCDSSIKNLRGFIYRKAWNKVLEGKSLNSVQHYIDFYFGTPYLTEAIKKRDAIAFQMADSIKTSQSYQSFIRTYPEAEQISQAKINLDDALFMEQTSPSSITSYEIFLRNYPHTKHKEEAENAIFNLFATEKTAEQLYDFIIKYPGNLNVSVAWDLLYSRFTSDQKKESFERFKLKYPEYPFTERINRASELSAIRLFPIIKGNKWGYIDSTGKTIIPEQYDEASNFHENVAAVKINGKAGYISKTGTNIIPIAYNETYDFSAGYAVVETDSFYGLIDKQGKWILPPYYSSIYGPYGRLYILEKEDKTIFFHAENNSLFEYDIDAIGDFNEGLCPVMKDGLKGWIDTSGKIVIPIQYKDVRPFIQGTAQVMKDGYWGLIDKSNRSIIPFKYDELGIFSENLIPVVLNGKTAFADKNGEIIIPFRKDIFTSNHHLPAFSDGLCRVEKNGKKGFIDRRGKIVIKPSFSDLGDFEEGLAPFLKNKSWGYLNKQGKVVIENSFQAAKPFLNQRAFVKKNGKWGIINSKGKIILAIKYEEITTIDKNYIITINGRRGLIDNGFKELIPAEFDEIKKSKEIGIIELYKNGLFAYFSLKNQKLFWKQEGF